MKYSILFILCLFHLVAPCQDQNWVLTNYYNANLPISGGLKMSFLSGNVPSMLTFGSNFNMNNSNACISSPSGNLRFYTNGVTLMNGVTNDTMINGTKLGKEYASATTDTFGLVSIQGILILPSPKDTNEYYVFYETSIYDANNSKFICDTFLYAKVNYPMGAGNGVVTVKDVILTTGEMALGGITACKHGNGKDWWIIKSGLNSDENKVFLLTENGVQLQSTQMLGTGMSMMLFANGAIFTPDGNKYIKTSDSLNRVLIYDFDRCTGTLSNLKILFGGYSNGGYISVAVSPNSRFAYFNGVIGVNYTGTLLQVDLSSSNPSNTIKGIVNTDIYPSNGSEGSLGELALAPDGKIYISPTDGIFSIIHEPDSEGIACQVELRALNTPAFVTPPLPNMPNYRLGVKLGSVCDTILSNTVILPLKKELLLYPNPAQECVYVKLEKAYERMQLRIWNDFGQLLHEEEVKGGQQEMSFFVKDFSEGVYFYELIGEKERYSGKFVKQKE